MAERERFELSRRFLPCTLSKGVPSTTRPSLREMNVVQTHVIKAGELVQNVF